MTTVQATDIATSTLHHRYFGLRVVHLSPRPSTDNVLCDSKHHRFPFGLLSERHKTVALWGVCPRRILTGARRVLEHRMGGSRITVENSGTTFLANTADPSHCPNSSLAALVCLLLFAPAASLVLLSSNEGAEKGLRGSTDASVSGGTQESTRLQGTRWR